MNTNKYSQILSGIIRKLFSALIIYSISISEGYAQADSGKYFDTTLMNSTFKQVLTETKKGLSREQISMTIIVSIAASLLAIIVYIIRDRMRASKN
jgi:hypothetical protein